MLLYGVIACSFFGCVAFHYMHLSQFLFIHSPIDGHLRCFPLGTITQNAAVNLDLLGC